jgi:membrane dipeptidase
VKRWLVGLAVVLAASATVLAFGPGLVERSMNIVDGKPLPVITPAGKALHAGLTIADMHADTLMWQRDLLEHGARGHADLPRLEDGRTALQIFSSVTKSPRGLNYNANSADSDSITALVIAQRQPARTWGSLLERSFWHAAKLRAAAEASDGRLRLITTSAQLDALLADRARGQAVTGAIFSLEGLHPLEGKLENLDRLHAAGMRMAGLTHFFDNEVAGSMHGLKKGGLTPLGVQVVRRMEELGIIVDIAHLSHTGVAQMLAMARRPVVSSHGGVQATCKENRNLTDEEIRGVARTGGVIGIGYWDGAVCSTDPRAIAAAIAHVRAVAGIDHVGLGSDFDGAVTTRFDAIGVVHVTQALMDAGFTQDEIAKVMGGNVLRVLRAGIMPRPRI